MGTFAQCYMAVSMLLLTKPRTLDSLLNPRTIKGFRGNTRELCVSEKILFWFLIPC